MAGHYHRKIRKTKRLPRLPRPRNPGCKRAQLLNQLITRLDDHYAWPGSLGLSEATDLAEQARDLLITLPGTVR